MRRVEVEQGRDIDSLLLDLHHLQGKTYAEIAEIINVPAPTVGIWVRARGLDAATLARKAVEESVA